MKKSVFMTLVILISALGFTQNGQAQWFLDFENGLAVGGYNDVQIPRETGTLFSLSEDLDIRSSYFFRIRAGYHWKSRHTISAFAAPLTLKASGKVDEDILFFGTTFPANTPLEAGYKFNSYRLTYRYDLIRKPKWQVGIGLTAKIRDAYIEVDGGGQNAKKTNVGFVPLLNFRILWQFDKAWGLLLEGDAAAAAQGRAEDVLLAIRYSLNDKVHIRIGYRIIEGGADVEEVYNFALIHFFGAGVTILF